MEASLIISETSALAVHNNVTPSIRNSLTWLLASRAIVPAAIMISESLNLAQHIRRKKKRKINLEVPKVKTSQKSPKRLVVSN